MIAYAENLSEGISDGAGCEGGGGSRGELGNETSELRERVGGARGRRSPVDEWGPGREGTWGVEWGRNGKPYTSNNKTMPQVLV